MGTTNFSALATDAGTVPAGTQAATIANTTAPSALTAAAAAGANPTKAEFDLLLDDVTALRATVATLVTKLNSVTAALKDFEIVASS